jgi:hypothetical protein
MGKKVWTKEKIIAELSSGSCWTPMPQEASTIPAMVTGIGNCGASPSAR